MALEQSVARHYTHGFLQAAIFGALEASGKDIDRLAPGDLAAVDEFHIGARQATVDFATQLPFGRAYIYSISAAAWVGRLVISLMNAAAE